VGTQLSWRQALALVCSAREDHVRAVELASESAALAATTDGLNVQGETLSDFALVLDRAGRPGEATERRREALDLFSRKKNVTRCRQLDAALAGAGGGAPISS
jgi:Flp pilus assembly protein TadD